MVSDCVMDGVLVQCATGHQKKVCAPSTQSRARPEACIDYTAGP